MAHGVGRERREEVQDVPSARSPGAVVIGVSDPGPLTDPDVADGDADVVPLVAGVVEVALDFVEAQLRADGVGGQGLERARQRAGVLEEEAARRVAGALRAGRRIDEGPDGGLVEGEEDRVVEGS